MRLDHIIVSVHNAKTFPFLSFICAPLAGLTDETLIKIGNKMPVAIVER